MALYKAKGGFFIMLWPSIPGSLARGMPPLSCPPGEVFHLQWEGGSLWIPIKQPHHLSYLLASQAMSLSQA